MPVKYSELESIYGAITPDGHWPDSNKHLLMYVVPSEIAIKLRNSLTGAQTNHMYLNHDMIAPLNKVFQKLITTGLYNELETFDGGYNVRLQRGSTDKWSTHSFGLAIDINAKDNPLGGESKWSPEFVQVWIDEGFSWGGNFARLDPMHFEWVSEE